MALTGMDDAGIADREVDALGIDLQRERAFENVEELRRFPVDVLNLRGARRHTLFDDAEILRVEKAPSVADIAPAVVLSIRPIHFWHGAVEDLLEAIAECVGDRLALMARHEPQ